MVEGARARPVADSRPGPRVGRPCGANRSRFFARSRRFYVAPQALPHSARRSRLRSGTRLESFPRATGEPWSLDVVSGLRSDQGMATEARANTVTTPCTATTRATVRSLDFRRSRRLKGRAVRPVPRGGFTGASFGPQHGRHSDRYHIAPVHWRAGRRGRERLDADSSPGRKVSLEPGIAVAATVNSVTVTLRSNATITRKGDEFPSLQRKRPRGTERIAVAATGNGVTVPL